MAPLTADTVTDGQIRELLRVTDGAITGANHYRRAVEASEIARLSTERDACVTALYEHDYPSARIDARARCAEIINARRAAEVR